MNTIQQDAQALDDALGTAIHYAKMLDDHEAVKSLVLIRRRLEKHFKTIEWNRRVIECVWNA